MNKHENLDNDQKELVKYWIGKIPISSLSVIGINEFTEKHLTPEPVIEVGFWYKSPGNKFMVFVEEYNPVTKMIIGFGFNNCGYWFNKTKTSYDKLEKATPEEYEPRLIEEANSKYKKGDVIKYKDRIGKIIGEIYFAGGCKLVSVGTDCKTHNNFFPLMENGKWAEIIDEKQPIRDEIDAIKKHLEELKSKL